MEGKYGKSSDQMTPKERMTAFAKGEEMDRIPIIPHMGVTLAPSVGITTKEYYFDPEKMAEAEIILFERLRQDSVSVSTTLRGMAEAMGAEIIYPENGISLLGKEAAENEEDIDNLKIIDPYKDGKLPILFEAIEIIRDRIGDEAAIGANLSGPFSVAASVIGTEKLLRWIVKKPQTVHKMMNIITKNNEMFIKAMGERGFGCGFSDPVSSMSLIKLNHFREFSLPYLKENIAHVKKYSGKKATVHICGKSKDLWESLLETEMGNFSLDNIEDLSEARDIMGESVTITGNVPPVDVMFLGKREDIRQSVKNCIEKGMGSTKGYFLGTGCQIPMGISLENLDAFMEAGREMGKLKR